MSNSAQAKTTIHELLKPLLGAIVHRIRTPLSSINMGVGAVQQIVPELFEAHKLVVSHELIQSDISESRLEMLESALPNINEEIQRTSAFLTSLLDYIDKLSTPVDDLPVLDVKTCVNDMIAQFPFKAGQNADLIHINIEPSFKFKAVPAFMEDLLSNFLDNALRAVKKAAKGEITISTGTEDNYNCLYFKDTGSGMNAEQASKVFSRYFSVREEITKAGLGFCRLAIISCGGRLSCESVEGQYTLLTLCFPRP